MRNLPIYDIPDMQTTPRHTGLHATVYRGEALQAFKEQVDRDIPLIGKVFHMPIANVASGGYLKEQQHRDWLLDNELWGMRHQQPGTTSTLREAFIVQNLLAYNGLAPRMYDLAIWYSPEEDFYRPVAIMDDLGTQRQPEIADAKATWAACKQQSVEQGWTMCTPDSDPRGNVMQRKWLDMNGCKIPPEFWSALLRRFQAGTRFGDRAYQAPLGARYDSALYCRSTDDRLIDLQLYDLRPASVLDVGCSGGQILNFYESYGARGLGFDHQRVVNAAAEWSYAHGHWNVDYQAADLRRGRPGDIGQFELVLCLSTLKHIGGLVDANRWILEAVQPGGRLVLEIHAQQKRQHVLEWVGDEFALASSHKSADYNRWVLHLQRGDR